MFYQTIQINKYTTEAHNIWSVYINSNRDLNRKIQLALNRSVTISHDPILSQLIPLNKGNYIPICIFKLMNQS
jgi:hypothetical protein